MDLVGRVLAERLVGQVDPRRSHDGKTCGQGALLGEVVQRGQQLAAAEVAGGAEDDHDRRVGDAIVVETLREWVRGFFDPHFSAAASLTTAWPPNCALIIASIRSPNVFSIRLRNRANSDSAITGVGTDSSIAASTVQRPSPVSSTQPLMLASSGSCAKPRATRSSSQERTTLPVLHASAIARMSMPGKDFDIFMTWKPSAYACMRPYSMPLWTIFTKCPDPSAPVRTRPPSSGARSFSTGRQWSKISCSAPTIRQ